MAMILPRNRPLLFARALIVLWVVYTILRFSWLAVSPPDGRMPTDFTLLHRAAERYVAGEAVYRAADPSPYKYSPTFLYAFTATFHQLPMRVSWFLWSSVSILFFAILVLWLWKTALASRAPPWQPRMSLLFDAAIIVALVAGWHGYLEHFSYGQCDMLLVALFLLAVALEDKPKRSALAMSTILLIKPQMAILLAYFLLRRKLNILGWVGVITVFLFVVPPAMIQGWDGLRLFHAWGQMLTEQQTVEFFTGNLNQSLAASIARWIHLPRIAPALTHLIVGMSGFIVLVAARRHPALESLTHATRARLAALTLVFYCVVTPLSWRWLTFIWLPAAAIFLFEAMMEWEHGPRSTRRTTHLILALLFCLNAALLQTGVAHALGIAEIDRLSGAGLYAAGNLLLLGLGTMLIAPFAKPISR